MSIARRSSPLLSRAALACGAALLFAGVADAATPAAQNPLADICTPLTHIIEAADFRQLPKESAAQLPGVTDADACRASSHSYDCHWRAHWQADGVINDPLEELGADIAACFANVVHDVNTPVRQHFIVKTDTRRVNVTANVQGQNELRLRVTR